MAAGRRLCFFWTCFLFGVGGLDLRSFVLYPFYSLQPPTYFLNRYFVDAEGWVRLEVGSVDTTCIMGRRREWCIRGF